MYLDIAKACYKGTPRAGIWYRYREITLIERVLVLRTKEKGPTSATLIEITL
jgi:hypothetical protein